MTREFDLVTSSFDLITCMAMDKAVSLEVLETLDDDFVKTEEEDPDDTSTTYSILGKALSFSLGTESGYETEGGTDEPEKWKNKPMEEWTADEVMDWIFNQAVNNSFHLPSLRGEMFQAVDGLTLSRMTEEDFVTKDEVNGLLLYRCLQEYKLRHEFNPDLNWTQKLPTHWTCIDVLDWIYYGSGLTDSDLMCLKGETFQGIDGQKLCSMSSSDFELRDHTFGVLLYSALRNYCENFMKPNGSQSHSVLGHSHRLQRVPSSVLSSSVAELDFLSPPPPESEFPEDPRRLVAVPASKRPRKDSTPGQPKTQPKERPKRPSPGTARQAQKRPRKTRTASSEDDDEDEAGSPSKTPKQSSKTRLWKFMRDLLDDPEYNPECIRWEDKEEGIFRIVAGRSQVIAKLWGKIKNNPTMTFDKLGRSLRWCRANNGKFSAVPKDGKFPRKLCFRLVEPDSEDQRTPPAAKVETFSHGYGFH